MPPRDPTETEPAVTWEIDRVLIQVVAAARKNGRKFQEVVLPAQPVAILPDPDAPGGFGVTLERLLPAVLKAAAAQGEAP